jgi:hypothetical protein
VGWQAIAEICGAIDFALSKDQLPEIILRHLEVPPSVALRFRKLRLLDDCELADDAQHRV